MKRGLLLVVFLLCMSPAFGFLSNVQFNTGDSFLVPGDDVNITWQGFDGDAVLDIVNRSCSLNGNSANFSNSTYSYVVSEIDFSNFTLSCASAHNAINVTVPYQNFTGGVDFAPAMVSIPNTITLTVAQARFEPKTLDAVGTILNATSCTFDFGEDVTFFSFPSSHEYTFDTHGDVVITGSCEFDSETVSVSIPFVDVKKYEPQLSLVDLPFGSLSAPQFKLGVYDFTLNGHDDLIVLGNDLRIYAGPNYDTLSYQNVNYNHTYNFIISDVNSNGLGDILIGNTAKIDLLRMNSEWSFTPETVFEGSNIKVFSVFNFDNNFEKDFLIVNGTRPNFEFSYFLNGDFSAKYSINQNFDCDNIYIFDVNKNLKEDIVCRRGVSSGSDRLNVYFRDDFFGFDFSQNFSHTFDGDINPNLYFADVTSDGNWELVVKSDRLEVYSVESNSISLIDSLNEVIDEFPEPSIGFIDLLNSQNRGILSGDSLDGESYPSTYYFNSLSSNFSFGNMLGPMTFIQSENTRDIIFSTYNETNDHRFLSMYKNNISEFITLDTQEETSIFIYPTLEGELNDTNSEQAKFNVSIASDWQYNDYLIDITFSSNNIRYRNDIFDSRLNMRYYLTDSSHEYTFNTSNYDEYTVTIRPNTYASILTQGAVETKVNSQCVFVPGEDWNISVVCLGYSTPDVKHIALNESALRVNTTQVNWNMMNITSDLVNFHASSGTILHSNFTDFSGSLNLNFTSGGLYTIKNSVFSNADIFAQNAHIEFHNVTFIGGSFIANESTLLFNNSDVSFGLIENSTVVVYDSVFDTDSRLNNLTLYDSSYTSILENGYLVQYNYSTVSFSNGTDPLSLSGNLFRSDGLNIPFTLVSQISQYWLTFNFTDFFTYDVLPNLDFMYFENQTTLTNFTTDTTIVYVPTGLPYWDYSVNTTHQTDFRNYTLLQGIESISDVELSYDTINITLLSTENYFGLNLTQGFLKTEHGFTLDLPGTYSLEFLVGDFENPLLLKDGVVTTDITLQDRLVTGDITSGLYEVVENVSFSVVVPRPIPGQPFSIEVLYQDYFEQTNYNHTCTLLINSVEYDFTEITLNGGVYDYEILCEGEDIISKSVVGTLTVSSVLFWDFPEEIGGFYVPTTGEFETTYNIIYMNSFISRYKLNNSFNIFHLSLNNLDIGKTLAINEFFYYEGVINSEKKEIIN